MANLTQLRMLETLNGFLLVDKPAGIAFSTVVKTVKRKFNLVKVGHGGSLDAAASGLFILLINDANKYTAEVMGADRAYTGAMRLGVKTNTHDIQGEQTGAGDISALTAEKVSAAAAAMRGDVFQTEPRFCSVRREGSAAYEIADTGEHAQFMAHVYRFAITSFEPPRAAFEISGSKGLLVRTLVNDVGEELGCGAALESLRRVKVGKFTVDRAIPFEKLLETEMKDFPSCVMPLGAALL
jgi:tRNA pseudouridine55 synthase